MCEGSVYCKALWVVHRTVKVLYKCSPSIRNHQGDFHERKERFKQKFTVLQDPVPPRVAQPLRSRNYNTDWFATQGHNEKKLPLQKNCQVTIQLRSWQERNNPSATCLPWKNALSGGWRQCGSIAGRQASIWPPVPRDTLSTVIIISSTPETTLPILSI